MTETRASAEADDDHNGRPVHVPGAAAGEIVPTGAEADAADAVGSGPSASGLPVAEVVPDPAPAEPVEAPPLFSDLGLSEPILRAVQEKGYLHPTPIQAQAIPFVLMGRDVLGVAQTGTGKTAGFTLPLLDILSGSRARARMPRSLILEPTRELALQVAENLVDYGRHLKLNHALLIGGESMSEQKEALNRGVDVLIATPGRLIDLFERGGLLLNDTRILVIDEADRMLDMGFIPDVERIVAMVSPMRQTLFFSATMAPEIKRLADAFLQNPKLITVSRAASVATTIVTGLALVEEADKRRALRALLRGQEVQNALIFCNRKRDVDVLAASLVKHGFSAGALHGDLAQSVRFATLERFKAGELRLLVCSDVAARGIDIGGLSHVFNFDVPMHAEDYVHRIGRTGRAGRTGHAFTIAGPEDRLLVEAIETLTAAPIPRISVPDIDQAGWAEIDSRRRGGRPGGAGGRDRDRGRKGGRDARRDRAPAPEARRPPPPPRPEPPAAREPDPPPAQTVAAQAAPPRAVHQDRPPRAAAGGGRDRPARERQQTERGYRRDDLGPDVLGFGDAVPDFMFLPRRAGAPTAVAPQTPRRIEIEAAPPPEPAPPEPAAPEPADAIAPAPTDEPAAFDPYDDGR